MRPAELPLRVRKEKADRKRKALAAVGLDENGYEKQEEEEEEEEEPKKEETPAAAGDAAASSEKSEIDEAAVAEAAAAASAARRRKRREPMSHSEREMLMEKALANVDSDVEFSDSEIPARPKGRGANIKISAVPSIAILQLQIYLHSYLDRRKVLRWSCEYAELV